MKKFFKLSQEGFTLVELMIVVAIIGILATIAVPQYQKFEAKSRQTEVRLALGAIHTVENSFAVDHNSFSGCLGNIGYSRDGTKFYYTVGFKTGIIGATVCGPTGATTKCNTYEWKANLNTDGTIAGYDAAASCDDGESVSYFTANQGTGGAAAVTKNSDLTSTNKVTTAVATDSFTVGAVGNVYKDYKDTWSIDQNKNMLNTLSGLNAAP